MADFASVADLEAFMGTTGLGARGTAMLGYASALIRRFTGQDLEATTGRVEEHAGGIGRAIIMLTQRPVTAVAITVDAVALAEDEFVWTRWGKVHKADWTSWETGPIVLTYDSGYAADSDEFAAIKLMCLEVAARALAGPAGSETFGLEVPEYRGPAPALHLTAEETMLLDGLSVLGVG